jgi:hypothetical protein
MYGRKEALKFNRKAKMARKETHKHPSSVLYAEINSEVTLLTK